MSDPNILLCTDLCSSSVQYQQVDKKLVGVPYGANPEINQGYSVSVTSNGELVAVGGPNANSFIGKGGQIVQTIALRWRVAFLVVRPTNPSSICLLCLNALSTGAT